MRFSTMWYVRPAKAQSQISLRSRLMYSMAVKLQAKHHFELLSLKEAAQAILSLHLSKYHIV